MRPQALGAGVLCRGTQLGSHLAILFQLSPRLKRAASGEWAGWLGVVGVEMSVGGIKFWGVSM